MSAMQGALSAAERSMRSVFVGNIPYEATEEQLKDIFSQVGPVVSFRLVYDRETGKPKGYGFCEYKDQEMALSAMRNLNNYELNGRALRVDNAASEKSKEELKNLQASLGGPPVESPYGPETTPEKAPEEISKVVASLPPEQMFELMKQMKLCIETNPNEARNLLLQNPQLAYALLQAQVIMKMVEPQVAMSMLHRPGDPALNPQLMPKQETKTMPIVPVAPPVKDVHLAFPSDIKKREHTHNIFKESSATPFSVPLPFKTPAVGIRTAVPTAQVRLPLIDPRTVTDRNMRQPVIDHNMRPSSMPIDKNRRRAIAEPVIDHNMRPSSTLVIDKNRRRAIADQDVRNLPALPQVIQDKRRFDPRFQRQGADAAKRGPPVPVPFDRPQVGPNFDPRTGYDGRAHPQNPPRIEDPRSARLASTVGPPTVPRGRMPANPRITAISRGSPLAGVASPNAAVASRQSTSLTAAIAAIAPQDQERASLILQVLQLSDQQIALLPPEQQKCVMVLKEEIARSRQA